MVHTDLSAFATTQACSDFLKTKSLYKTSFLKSRKLGNYHNQRKIIPPVMVLKEMNILFTFATSALSINPKVLLS